MSRSPFTRSWSAFRSWTEPALSAGVAPGLDRREARELVTGNLVVLLSIAVTVPDILNFRSFHSVAGDQAAVFAGIATAIYLASYGLLALGRRWLGICIFTNVVIWVLVVNIALVGTDLGNQYYFAIVGVGVAFVWPRRYHYMRYIHAAIGLIAFLAVMRFATAQPLDGSTLPRGTATAMMLVHASSAYAIAIGFVIYSQWLTQTAEEALDIERERSEELLRREVAYQVAERSRELGATLARGEATFDARSLSPGEQFADRYRIVGSIGAGAMGTVYEVERSTDAARLALKTISGDRSPDAGARFAREAEIGARVRHRNVVPIVDVGVVQGVPFLVMELVRGGTLEHRRSRFGDTDWGLPILGQVAEGLAVLHAAGVLHRDLKPSNILLADDPARPTARISDFGISRIDALPGSESTISRLTRTGIMLGTPLYMAPETGLTGASAPSADVFSFGVVAYELLCGRLPFEAPPMLVALAQKLPEPVFDDGNVPAPVRDCVIACLAEKPARRPRITEVQQVFART